MSVASYIIIIIVGRNYQLIVDANPRNVLSKYKICCFCKINFFSVFRVKSVCIETGSIVCC